MAAIVLDPAATLAELAADARADPFLAELATCLEGQVAETTAVLAPTDLLTIAGRLAGGSATAARLAVVLVETAGKRTAWSGPAAERLTALRGHPDLRVRHAARSLFMRPESAKAAEDLLEFGDD